MYKKLYQREKNMKIIPISKCGSKKPFFVFFLLFTMFSLLFISGCDLLNPMPENDLQKKMDAQIAYAKAPWVPLKIDTDILGIASLMGSQPNTVKLGYSFKLTFQPYAQYPFLGWQAWVEGEEYSAYWNVNNPSGAAGENRVKFVPLNESGTEVEIFVYTMPPNRKELCIGPIGAADGFISVTPHTGDLGIIYPANLNRVVKQGFPFTMSFQPSAGYPFRGWQIKCGNEVLSKWVTGDDEVKKDNGITWAIQNASGTDVSVTIVTFPPGYGDKDSYIIGPYGMDNPPVSIRLESNGMGNITSSGETSFNVRLGY